MAAEPVQFWGYRDAVKAFQATPTMVALKTDDEKTYVYLSSMYNAGAEIDDVLENFRNLYSAALDEVGDSSKQGNTK